MLTEDEVRQMLKDRVAEKGSMRSVAEELGVSISYISMVCAGRKGISAPILDMLGLEAETVYFEKGPRYGTS